MNFCFGAIRDTATSTSIPPRRSEDNPPKKYVAEEANDIPHKPRGRANAVEMMIVGPRPACGRVRDFVGPENGCVDSNVCLLDLSIFAIGEDAIGNHCDQNTYEDNDSPIEGHGSDRVRILI